MKPSLGGGHLDRGKIFRRPSRLSAMPVDDSPSAIKTARDSLAEGPFLPIRLTDGDREDVGHCQDPSRSDRRLSTPYDSLRVAFLSQGFARNIQKREVSTSPEKAGQRPEAARLLLLSRRFTPTLGATYCRRSLPLTLALSPGAMSTFRGRGDIAGLFLGVGGFFFRFEFSHLASAEDAVDDGDEEEGCESG